jgi:Pup-like protein
MASARSQARSNLPRQDAEALAEEDAAKAAAAAATKTPARNEVAEDADELLDEIDALLEEQSVLTNFRQKGGQ